MPLRSTSPETTRPIAQLVSARLTKNAISGRPNPHRLKPKNHSASTVTGTRPMASRITLIVISARTNSIGLSGLISRLPMLRDHISSRNDMEKPSWARNSVSHRSSEPISVPPATAMRAAEARRPGLRADVGLQEAPGQHLHRRPIEEVERGAARTSASDRDSAPPSRRRARARSRSGRRSLMPFAPAIGAARDVEEHLFEISRP